MLEDQIIDLIGQELRGKTLGVAICLVLLLGIASYSCNERTNETIDGQCYTVNSIDSSANVFLETKEFSGSIFSAATKIYTDNNFKRFTPTVNEIFRAEKILKRCLESGKSGIDGMEIDKRRIRLPSEYYRQYLGYYNAKGQKVIYFNCFLKESVKSDNHWKQKEIIVNDGGNNYFSILINLAVRDCSLFMVHSRA